MKRKEREGEELEYDHQKPNNRASRGVNWIGTLFGADYEKIKQEVSDAVGKGTIRYCVFQQEKCGTTGSLHIQIFLQLTHALRLPGVQALLGGSRDHWEIAHAPAKARNYCRKQDTRSLGPDEFGEWCGGSGQGRAGKHDEAFKKIETMSRQDHIAAYPELWSTRASGLNLLFNQKLRVPPSQSDFKPNQWQRFLRGKLMEQADERAIWWIYDSQGGHGKTKFSRWMASKGGVFLTSTSKADRQYFAYDGESIIIYDVPRAGDNGDGEAGKHFPYNQLECFKNGSLPSGMFGTGPKHFATPHVVVMANFEPDFARLTGDRWRLLDLFDSGSGTLQFEDLPCSDGRGTHGTRYFFNSVLLGGPCEVPDE